MILSNNVIQFLFLLPLLIIGIISSYDDIKYGKIRNKYLKFALIYVLFLYLFLNLYSILIHKNNSQYFINLFFNGLISLVLGYLLWYFDWWSAGDAKLFFIYSLLIPLEYYKTLYWGPFFSLIILFDTFFLILSFIILKISIYFLKMVYIFVHNIRNLYFKKNMFEGLSRYLKLVLTRNNVLNWLLNFYILISIIGFRMMIYHLLLINNTKWNVIFNIIFFIVYLLIIKFLKKNLNKVVAIFILPFIIYLCLNSQILLQTLRQFITMLIIFGFLYKIINWYIENVDVKDISVKDLKEGMCLTPNSKKIIYEQLSKSFQQNSLVCNFNNKNRLTLSDIILIKTLLKNDSLKLYVYNILPFAPFLLTAVIYLLLTHYSISQIFLGYLSKYIQ